MEERKSTLQHKSHSILIFPLVCRFFENIFKYGGSNEKGPFVSPGPQYRRQNNNFDGGSPHVTHIGATAYAYLDSMWMFGYTAEMSVFPMVIHFLLMHNAK
jgi:hypothetical protein